jgi:hypothetical protein
MTSKLSCRVIVIFSSFCSVVARNCLRRIDFCSGWELLVVSW